MFVFRKWACMEERQAGREDRYGREAREPSPRLSASRGRRSAASAVQACGEWGF
jgi:hypothetical protein